MGPEDQERASRNRFYEGLRGELKHPLKYLVGRPEGATYSELIEEARRMEGRACGPVLPSEFNGPTPKKDPVAAAYILGIRKGPITSKRSRACIDQL